MAVVLKIILATLSLLADPHVYVIAGVFIATHIIATAVLAAPFRTDTRQKDIKRALGIADTLDTRVVASRIFHFLAAPQVAAKRYPFALRFDRALSVLWNQAVAAVMHGEMTQQDAVLDVMSRAEQDVIDRYPEAEGLFQGEYMYNSLDREHRAAFISEALSHFAASIIAGSMLALYLAKSISDTVLHVTLDRLADISFTLGLVVMTGVAAILTPIITAFVLPIGLFVKRKQLDHPLLSLVPRDGLSILFAFLFNLDAFPTRPESDPPIIHFLAAWALLRIGLIAALGIGNMFAILTSAIVRSMIKSVTISSDVLEFIQFLLISAYNLLRSFLPALVAVGVMLLYTP